MLCFEKCAYQEKDAKNNSNFERIVEAILKDRFIQGGFIGNNCDITHWIKIGYGFPAYRQSKLIKNASADISNQDLFYGFKKACK